MPVNDAHGIIYAMGIIRIYESSKGKSKRKPGWEKQQKEYDEWLAKVSSMSSGIQTSWKGAALAKRAEKKSPAEVLAPLKAAFVKDSGTKSVSRPEIEYRDNPEMLERERIARGVKHNALPAYNKAGDSYVTEAELKNFLSTNKRRS